MNEHQLKKQLTKNINLNLDIVYNAAKKIASYSGNKKALSLESLVAIASKAELKTDTKIKAMNAFNKQYNVVLTSIVIAAESKRKALGEILILLAVLKECIDLVREQIKK